MAVVYDARLGGHAVTLIGIESRPLPRHGVTPADGPAQWSAGTLFPLSSKKVARAINAAERRPAGRRAGQPVRLRRLAGVAAPPAARVRRRDRPGDRQLRRAVRAVRRVPLPRRGVRRVLGDAQRRHGGARRRGLVRLGDRRRAGGGGGVHPRRRRAHAAPTRGCRRLEAAVADASFEDAGARRAELAAIRDDGAHREARRGRRRVRRRPQRRAGPAGRLGAPDHRRRRPAPGADRRRRAGDGAAPATYGDARGRRDPDHLRQPRLGRASATRRCTRRTRASPCSPPTSASTSCGPSSTTSSTTRSAPTTWPGCRTSPAGTRPSSSARRR